MDLKVVAYNGQYRITIPKDIAIEKKWKPGTKLKFVETESGEIVIREVKNEK